MKVLQCNDACIQDLVPKGGVVKGKRKKEWIALRWTLELKPIWFVDQIGRLLLSHYQHYLPQYMTLHRSRASVFAGMSTGTFVPVSSPAHSLRVLPGTACGFPSS